jgi:hypothetical protein
MSIRSIHIFHSHFTFTYFHSSPDSLSPSSFRYGCIHVIHHPYTAQKCNMCQQQVAGPSANCPGRNADKDQTTQDRIGHTKHSIGHLDPKICDCREKDGEGREGREYTSRNQEHNW